MPLAIVQPGSKLRRGAMTKPVRNIVVFDLGGVLVDWDPRHLYLKLFSNDETAMEHFLAYVCTDEWNRAQDAGRSFAEGARLLKRQHPDKAELIDAYHARFDEMIAGPIAGTVEILAELRDRGAPLYGLTNWSAETYPLALERFEFLSWFRGILVSGEVGAIKPDPRIYGLMLASFAIDPRTPSISMTTRRTPRPPGGSASTAFILRRPTLCGGNSSDWDCSAIIDPLRILVDLTGRWRWETQFAPWPNRLLPDLDSRTGFRRAEWQKC